MLVSCILQAGHCGEETAIRYSMQSSLGNRLGIHAKGKSAISRQFKAHNIYGVGTTNFLNMPTWG